MGSLTIRVDPSLVAQTLVRMRYRRSWNTEGVRSALRNEQRQYPLFLIPLWLAIVGPTLAHGGSSSRRDVPRARRRNRLLGARYLHWQSSKLDCRTAQAPPQELGPNVSVPVTPGSRCPGIAGGEPRQRPLDSGRRGRVNLMLTMNRTRIVWCQPVTGWSGRIVRTNILIGWPNWQFPSGSHLSDVRWSDQLDSRGWSFVK